MDSGYRPNKNHEGYHDPTACVVIDKIDKEETEDRSAENERFYKLLGCIFRVCELAGFSVEEHIVLRDRQTGKVWR